MKINGMDVPEICEVRCPSSPPDPSATFPLLCKYFHNRLQGFVNLHLQMVVDLI